MTIKLENISVEGGSLEPTLLERICEEITKLESINRTDHKALSGWWRQLTADFQRLNQNYQDYIRDWHSAKTDELLKTKKFLIYKEKLVEYLRGFIVELQIHAQKIEGVLNAQTAEAQSELCQSIGDAAQEKDRALSGYERALQNVKAHLQLSQQIKDEYSEQLLKWRDGNSQLTIDREVCNQTIERVYQYRTRYRFEQVIEPLKIAYDAALEKIRIEKALLSAEQSQLAEQLAKAKLRYQALKDMPDLAPERSDAIIANRQYLKAQNIPHMPFYLAVQFKDDIDSLIKDHIEAALVQMGLLDALIVPKSYRAEVMQIDQARCDRYIFADPQHLRHNLSTYLRVASQRDGAAISSTLIADAIASITLDADAHHVSVDERGRYCIGILHGTSDQNYSARFIGKAVRALYRQQLLDDAQRDIADIELSIVASNRLGQQLEMRLNDVTKDWQSLPAPTDIDVALDDYQASQLEADSAESALNAKEEQLEMAHQALKELEKQRTHYLANIYIAHNIATLNDALEALESYAEQLKEMEIADLSRWHIQELIYRAEARIDDEQCTRDNLIDDIADIQRSQQQLSLRVQHIVEQLQKTDYQSLQQALLSCIERLEAIPPQVEACIERRSNIKSQNARLAERIAENERKLTELAERAMRYRQIFAEEYNLAYLEEMPLGDDLYSEAVRVFKKYKEDIADNKNINDYSTQLLEKFHEEQGELTEYNIKRIQRFQVVGDSRYSDEERAFIERFDIVKQSLGKAQSLLVIRANVAQEVSEKQLLLQERERELFEEILLNTISKKISAKIYHSEQWVKKIDGLMKSMDTSSGLNLSLSWTTKRATVEDQLSTRDLVDMLRGDQRLLSMAKKAQLTAHFRSKIAEIKSQSEYDKKSFFSMMKEILDYRKWFDFKLYYTKKELTNHAFDRFSGGEKAMSMYVPLFAAVYAKYSGARKECPKIISLDEAFAGVDKNNIQDMFRLLVELDLSFIANSQVLFGDYKTIPRLSIYELIRPDNQDFVTLIRYIWDGYKRILVDGDQRDD